MYIYSIYAIHYTLATVGYSLNIYIYNTVKYLANYLSVIQILLKHAIIINNINIYIYIESNVLVYTIYSDHISL